MKPMTPKGTRPSSDRSWLASSGSAAQSCWARLRTSVDEWVDSMSVKPCGSTSQRIRGPKVARSFTWYPGRGSTRKSNSFTSRSPVRPSADSHSRRSVPGCSQSLPTTQLKVQSTCAAWSSRSESYVANGAGRTASCAVSRMGKEGDRSSLTATASGTDVSSGQTCRHIRKISAWLQLCSGALTFRHRIALAWRCPHRRLVGPRAAGTQPDLGDQG
eukprot:1419404-Prymnesium_polylepis.1